MSASDTKNQDLRDEVATLKATIESLNTQMTQLLAAQNQAHSSPVQTSTVAASTTPFKIPTFRPWGMDANVNQGSQPLVTEIPTYVTQSLGPIL